MAGVSAKAPFASVVADTSPIGNCAGDVAPTIGTGPTITVAFASAMVCDASADAYVTPAIAAGPYASAGNVTTLPATVVPA